MRYLVHGALERLLIGLRALGAAADFSHVLQRRGVDFLGRGVRFVVVEGTDIPAHTPMLGSGTPRIATSGPASDGADGHGEDSMGSAAHRHCSGPEDSFEAMDLPDEPEAAGDADWI